jgi:hypothetical protein
MANTYKWKILQLDAKIKLNDLDNVIYTVHWRYCAEDNSDPENVIYRDIIGTFGLVYNPDVPFIEYDNLTKEDVVGWLEAGLDVENMKTNLDEQIELQKNPVDEHLQPEWD